MLLHVHSVSVLFTRLNIDSPISFSRYFILISKSVPKWVKLDNNLNLQHCTAFWQKARCTVDQLVKNLEKIIINVSDHYMYYNTMQNNGLKKSYGNF